MSKDLFLFISPHLDDVALSCGGLIRRLADANQSVLALTVFTADLPEDVSPSWLARRNHAAWNAGSRPFAARRMEDENAMRELGADFLHLGFLDAMYRSDESGIPYYSKNTVGVPPVTNDEEKTSLALSEKLLKIAAQHADKTVHVFCPFTLGRHVDHVIVRRGVESVWKETEIFYYEDYPYAGRAGVWTNMQEDARNWKPFRVRLNEVEMSARVHAIVSYSSQLRGLFPSFLERTEEILRARIGFLRNLRFGRNHAVASRIRANAAVRSFVGNVGGEQYWFLGETVPEAFTRYTNLF